MPGRELSHFYNFDLWFDLNDFASGRISGSSDRAPCRLYKGLYAGLFEMTIAMSRQFPLKKQVVYFKGLDPFLDLMARQFSRDGYELVSLAGDQTCSQQPVLEKVSKETLLVLMSLDDPFFGRLHGLDRWIEPLSEQRVYTVVLSHHQHRVRGLSSPVAKYAAEIHHFKNDLALARLGARVRYADSIAPFTSWSFEDLEPLNSELLGMDPPLEDSAKIHRFEESLPQGWRPYFDQQVGEGGRLFDRSVIYNESVDATAVIEALCELRGIQPGSSQQKCLFETTSLSRWGGLKTLDWLEGFGWTPLQRRGGLILSLEAIDDLLLQQIEDITKRLNSSATF